ncbi:hypothetical protein BD779DRAFT_1774805 [Infundibulicybe gibba]|nr:hypothetical protein BD779DRAFT_1774805 [Infundibulicybe gibba]
MFNRSIVLLPQSHLNGFEIKFTRNDPAIILGSAVSRKPDTFGGDQEVFSDDVLNFVELKPLYWYHSLSASDPVSELSSSTIPGSSTNGLSPTVLHAGVSVHTTTGPLSGIRLSNSESVGETPGAGCISNSASSRGSGIGASEGSRSQTTDIAVIDAQCAGYARELLSHGNLCPHVIAALVTDDSIELLYCDRSINIKSEPLNFNNDQERLVAWVIGMIRFDAPGWGFDPVDPHVRCYRDIAGMGMISKSLYKDYTVELGPGWELRIKGMIFNAHCIIGRDTTAFLAKVKAMPKAKGREWLKNTVIMKLSNPAESRLSEIETVTNALRRAASSDDARRFLKNLPLIIYHEDRTAGRVQMALLGHFGNLYELRVPRAIIMEQLFPITELTDAASAAPVYRDIVECYQWLFDVCKIRHSDISINNLMYRRDGGRTHDPQSRQRTGTKQFMAYDLLDPHKSHSHFYRHDLESIFYVMVFHLCGHHQGQEVNFISIEDWVGATDKALWKTKYHFLGNDMPRTTEHFTPLSTWLDQLSEIFQKGYAARPKKNKSVGAGESNPFDEETLGGHVTFAIFKKIISPKNGI